MKKLFFLILAIVCSVVIANAQNTSGTSKVALKNGIVIEGTVTTQGDDIIVTTANGDMFYYSRSEISSITAPRDSNVSRVESSSPSLSFRKEPSHQRFHHTCCVRSRRSRLGDKNQLLIATTQEYQKNHRTNDSKYSKTNRSTRDCFRRIFHYN